MTLTPGQVEALGDLERAEASARHAVRLADEEARKGSGKSTELLQAAEAFADRVLLFEREIGGLEQDLLQATQAAEQAKAEEEAGDLSETLANEQEKVQLLEKYLEARKSAEADKQRLSAQMSTDGAGKPA